MDNDAAPPNLPAPPSLSQRLWVILGGLRQALAALGGRDRAAVPLVVLAWARVGRIAQRFEALLARLAAGRLAPAPIRVRVRVRPPVDGAAVRLPRGFGWMVRLLQESANFGSQLQALLAEPEMTALLAACPRAGRLLRPLCHMLGIVGPGMKQRPDPKPTRPKAGAFWWQAAAVCPAPPLDWVPFPPGRPPPPGWIG